MSKNTFMFQLERAIDKLIQWCCMLKAESWSHSMELMMKLFYFSNYEGIIALQMFQQNSKTLNKKYKILMS